MISRTDFTGAAEGACRLASSAVWVHDANGVRLIDPRTRSSWTLSETDATIWNLLVLGYSFHKTVAFLSDLLRVPPEQAESIFLSALSRWRAEGVLEVVQGASDDEPGDQRGL